MTGRSVLFFAIAILFSLSSFAQDRTVTEAGFDSAGNIYVVSDEGKPIVMTTLSHCGETSQAPNRQTMLCNVKPGGNSSYPTWNKLEIYLRGGKKTVIQTEAPIREWHFWNDGDQIAVFAGAQQHQGVHSLYDASTGHVVESVPEPIDEKLLPVWAKSRAQLQDEAVPESAELNQQRTQWISKVLRQIGKIQPGMTRQDLDSLFHEDGGLSSRIQQTYVFINCELIKVDVRFRPSDGTTGFPKKPDDVIESISKPYLAWPTRD